MASALKIVAGQASRVTVRSAWVRACTSGWFWQEVPSRFQMKAIASSRITSTPWLARSSTMSAYSQNTSGLAQLTSHCQLLNVVQTQPSSAPSCSEVAGREVRKHLRQARLVRVRDAPVGIHVEVVAVSIVPGPGPGRPLVLRGNVVEHQVEAQ